MDNKVGNARGRLIRHMANTDSPITVREAHRRMSGTLDTDERWELLKQMILSKDIHHKDGLLTLLTKEVPNKERKGYRTELPNSDDLM